MTYGATPDDWDYWDLAEGCTADLLPVVCRPNAQIHPRSVLQQYGKVPSRYTVERQVVGFPNWTSYQATARDVAQWRADPDLGICLQTRSLRALDFDLTDAAYAEYVRDALALLGYRFPYRTRSNSPKFLTLFRLEGEHRKQILNTPYGSIEFLATGQQCIVAGTHPSGARYEWDWSTPIPAFTDLEWSALQEDLREIVGKDVVWSGPIHGGVVDRDHSIKGRVEDDPVARFLIQNGWVVE